MGKYFLVEIKVLYSARLERRTRNLDLFRRRTCPTNNGAFCTFNRSQSAIPNLSFRNILRGHFSL